MFIFKRNEIKEKAHVLEELKRLKEEETKLWNWVREGRGTGAHFMAIFHEFEEILSDMANFLADCGKAILIPDNEPYNSKIKEIHTLVGAQVRRFYEEIAKNEGKQLTREIIESILDHEKDHGAEYSKLSTLLDEAINIGESPDANKKSGYEISENFTYGEGVKRYVEGDIAQFGLPRDIFKISIEDEKLYEKVFWTSASVFYNSKINTIKLVLSKDKKINKLLSYDLIKERNDFLPATQEDYDAIPEGHKDVYIIPWDDDANSKIKELIIEGVEDFQNRFKYPEFSVDILEKWKSPPLQWRPLCVYLIYESDVLATEDMKSESHFLVFKD